MCLLFQMTLAIPQKQSVLFYLYVLSKKKKNKKNKAPFIAECRQNTHFETFYCANIVTAMSAMIPNQIACRADLMYYFTVIYLNISR